MSTSPATAPDTIVLVHGFWVTPRSRESWAEHYRNSGYRVLAPAYPGFEVEVEVTHKQWHYAFTNTFTDDESRALYERCCSSPVARTTSCRPRCSGRTPGTTRRRR